MWVDSRKRQDKAREAEPETGRTGKVLFAEKKKGCSATKYGRGHVSEGDAQMCRECRMTPEHTKHPNMILVGVFQGAGVCLAFCGEVSLVR